MIINFLIIIQEKYAEKENEEKGRLAYKIKEAEDKTKRQRDCGDHDAYTSLL